MFERTASHILLVEDNALDVDLIRHALQKVEPGVFLSLARDGEEALAHFKQWETGAAIPIVILLDLKLPKLSGLDILKVLKAHPRFKILPVVVLTSSNETSDVQQAYALGANSYIRKSVDYDELAKAVELIHRYWCGLNIHPE